MKPDIEQAMAFFKLIAPETLITFQTFSDSQKKQAGLADILHGVSDANIGKLISLNEMGAGVFFMVNEGDGNGRKAENVTGVRAVFIDLDGTPLPEEWGLIPHATVESSPGRYHAYWRVHDCPLDRFTSVQKALAESFNSDKSVNDLPRVMRVPGFFHQKGEAFMTSILSVNESDPYALQQVIDGLNLSFVEKTVPSLDCNANSSADYINGSGEGGRTSLITKLSRSVSNHGYTEDEAVQFCITFDKLHNDPPLESTHPGKVEATVRDIYKRYVYTDVPGYVTELNEKYFVAREGGKTVVCREVYNPVLKRDELIYSTFSDFKNYYCNRIVKVGPDIEGKVVFKTLGVAWTMSKHRRQYDGIVMAPLKDVPNHFNLWRGFAVKSVKGSWKLMKKHIFLIICGGDKKLFIYVMGWLARMIQQPGLPGEVALVLQGEKGTGKGMLINALCIIFGQHACHVFSSKHVSGHFNGHLEDTILLFPDEAFFAGDKASEQVLKGLITEPTIPIERKFVDLKIAPNMLHIIMASNSDWVVPAGIDERRYCVLKVSSVQKGNHGYFEALMQEIENGGLEAMLYDLQHWDISAFNVREVPQTPGLLEQKLQSMDPIPAWWYMKLQDGSISQCHDWESLPTKLVYQDYLETTSKMSGQIRKANEISFGMAFAKLLPDGWPQKKKQPKNTITQARIQHYVLPPLNECRAYFDFLIKGNIEWEVAHLETDVVLPFAVDPEM